MHTNSFFLLLQAQWRLLQIGLHNFLEEIFDHEREIFDHEEDQEWYEAVIFEDELDEMEHEILEDDHELWCEQEEEILPQVPSQHKNYLIKIHHNNSFLFLIYFL